MDSIRTALRNTFVLVMLAATIGAALSWRRGRVTTPTPATAPVWPPLPSHEPEPLPVSEQTWVGANDDGSTPTTHPIKAKDASGIFHSPGGRFYDRTKADRCYPTAAAAEADGYRRSKS